MTLSLAKLNRSNKKQSKGLSAKNPGGNLPDEQQA
jgi:hypothetical protein